LIALPEKVHRLPQAVVTDLTCMQEGDEWCTYEVNWIESDGDGILKGFWKRLRSGMHRFTGTQQEHDVL
jgi:hypothetical protein